MTRYYFDFDIHETAFARDEEGKEFVDFESARRQAIQDLHSRALNSDCIDGNRQTSTVILRTGSEDVVYSGTLVFAGACLGEEKHRQNLG